MLQACSSYTYYSTFCFIFAVADVVYVSDSEMDSDQVKHVHNSYLKEKYKKYVKLLRTMIV